MRPRPWRALRTDAAARAQAGSPPCPENSNRTRPAKTPPRRRCREPRPAQSPFSRSRCAPPRSADSWYAPDFPLDLTLALDLVSNYRLQLLFEYQVIFVMNEAGLVAGKGISERRGRCRVRSRF